METPPFDLAKLDEEIGQRLLRARAKKPRIRLAEAMVEQLENAPHRKTVERFIMEIEHGQRPMTLGFAIVLCRATGIEITQLAPELVRA